jgi:ribosomal protein S18 acetylase RimI-like enzyme
MTFRLRPAEEADLDFIWRLRVATMKETISESYGWDEETQRGYAAESLRGEIVLIDERPLGVLTLADWGDEMHIVWMAVLPEMQRQGLGSALIEHCQRKALEAGKPLTLQVLRNNRAVSLYRRHGFEVYAQNGPQKLLMRWSHRAS